MVSGLIDPGGLMDDSQRGRRACALAIAALLALAACGGDDDGEGDDGAAAGSADAAASAGDGPTITIGYVNNEGGAVSLPEYRIGGEVAVDYINAHGGINGTTIELVGCEADGSPEGSINCANQLIDAGVVVAYTGIDLASDAALPLYKSAGIPYVTTSAWGTAQRNDEGSFVLHTAISAYAAAPLATFEQLGAETIAVLNDESTPAGQEFLDGVVEPIAEDLGLEVVPVAFDLTNPDYTQAVTSAMASDPDGIMAQLDEAGCVGLVTATSTLGFDGPVMPGSCSAYIDELGEASVGTYVFQPVYSLDTRDHAPPEIQEHLDIFEAAMTDAGHEDLLDGFANVPFSGVMELASILETIDGEVTSQAVVDAFHSATTSPGFLGSDLHCGEPPVADETSACRGDYLAFEVVAGDDGTPVKEQVGDGFHDVSDLLS